MKTEPQTETIGEVWTVAARGEKHRRYARLFAAAMTTTDEQGQTRILAEINRMVGMDTSSCEGDAE